METDEIQVVEKLDRTTILELLTERDGSACQYPGCGNELDFSITDDNDPFFVTIDHWMPKSYLRKLGMTWAEIWDIDNLRLMEKKCNAKKGDRVPNSDGSIPERARNTFRYRRQKRAERPEICTACNAGRNLLEGQICASCNSGPMPLRAPRWKKRNIRDCDHAILWCPGCAAGWIPRASAEEMIYLNGEGGE